MVYMYCLCVQIASKESEELIKGNNEKMKQMEETITKKDVIINELKSNITNMEQELKELRESKLSPGNRHEENLQQGNVHNFINDILIHACMHAYTHTHTRVCTHKHTLVHTHIHTHISSYVDMHCFCIVKQERLYYSLVVIIT